MPTLSFDDLIPAGGAASRTPQPRSAMPSPQALTFDDLVPEANKAANVGGRPVDASPMDYAVDSANVTAPYQHVPDTPRSARPSPGFGASMLEMERNNLLAARQRTDPSVYDGDKPLRRKLGVIVPEYSDMGQVPPNSYVNDQNQLVQVDPKKQVVLIDPASGQPTVFERNFDAEGTDVTEEPMWKSLARVIAPGLVVNPVVGPARVAGNVNRATRAATTAERAQYAADDLMSFERAQVPVFAPAFASGPVRATAKGISDTKLVGAPVRNAIEDTYRGARDANQRLAGEFGASTSARESGVVAANALERFRDARPVNVVEDAIGNLSDARLGEIIAAPASATSLKTKQAALYERAWRNIPEEMRRGRAVEGAPRIMQSPENTRRVLQEIQGRNARMTVQSGANAAPEAVTRPVQGGLLGQMINAVNNPRWTANLQTLRDMRSEFRRLASGMADTEKNTLKLSDIQRIQSGFGQDIVALMQRNATSYRDLARQAAASRNMARARELTNTAAGFERAIREFNLADRFTRLSMQRLETIEKLFKAESAEALYRNITNAALSGGKGNLDLLRSVESVLRPAERNEIAAGLLREMGRPVGSARGIVEELGFSVESFMTRWNNMTPEARSLLFGNQHTQAVNDFLAVARRLANVETFANRSNSGIMAVNVGGALTAAGAFLSGGWMHVLGAAAGGYGLSLLLSRPGYARWATRYLQLKAGASRTARRTGGAMTTNKALAAHINRLGQMAQRDEDLLPVYRSIAAEEGIVEGNDNERDPESSMRLQNGDQRPNDQLGSPHTGGTSTDQRFNPPMRLGGPRPVDGAFAPTAPTPGNVPPQAELRSYNPSPSESAAFYTRQGAEALGIPPSQAERIGQGAGAAVNMLTPLDDVSDAVGSGSAASAAAAGLSFIPGFRGGKKVTEAAVDALSAEVDKLSRQLAALGGRTRPTHNPRSSLDDQAKELQETKDWLEGEIASARASRPVSNTSVPVTTSAQQRELEKAIDKNPYTQAIPGRQGLPSKTEQKQLAREFFEMGEELPAAPWGRDPVSDVKHALATAYARGRKVSEKDASAVESAAKKASKAADEAKELRMFAEATPNGTKELQARLDKAEANAAHWKAQYDALMKRVFGD